MLSAQSLLRLKASQKSPVFLSSMRHFAKRKRKVARPKKGHNYEKAWTYAKYIRHKDPNTSYKDEESEGWTYTAGMAVERLPRIYRCQPAWFNEWTQFQDQLDLVRCKQVPLDWLQTKKGMTEDANRVLKPNPRITDEDRENARRSIHRCLDVSTFLLVKTARGWHFPEGAWEQSESIRETAEKRTAELCGKDLDTYLLGNGPLCHLVDADSKNKFFLMHNLLVGGNVELDNADLLDFAWVQKSEFPEYIKDAKLLEQLEKVFYNP